jgi:hypothetical protein
MALSKTEIISKLVNDAACIRCASDDVPGDGERYNEAEIVAILQVSLKNASLDEQVRTCEDFSHIDVECCATCHNFHPHYEMALIDIESGGNAWICCALDRALNPQKQAERKSSPQWKAISKILDGDVVDLELFLQNGLSD